MAKLMVHAIQKRRQSAPSAAFFVNPSPLPSAQNLEKVLEESEGDEVYEARSMSPPLMSTPPVRRKTLAATGHFSPGRNAADPRLGEGAAAAAFQAFVAQQPQPPRELSQSPPKHVGLAPKPRTPVPSPIQERIMSIETMLCDLSLKMDSLTPSTRRPTRLSVRKRSSVVSERRIVREQGHIRTELGRISLRLSKLSRDVTHLKRLSAAGQSEKKPAAKFRNLDEILTQLHIKEYREVFVREKIGKDDFLLLSRSDLRELGLPLGIQKRILVFLRSKR